MFLDAWCYPATGSYVLSSVRFRSKGEEKKMPTRRSIYTLFSLMAVVLIVLAACGGPALGSADNPIVMSFVPSGDTPEILASGEEIAKMISDRTGLTVKANVATSYAAVVEAMGAGQAHVGWLAPFSYVVANTKGYADVALSTVRFGSDHYGFQIIARADSGIASVTDLSSKKLCWTDPLSTSGYVTPLGYLADEGVDQATLDGGEFLGGHTAVVRGVYQGQCDAGATFVDARGSVATDFPDVNEQVIQIYVSEPFIPNDTVSYAKSLPQDIRDKITNALLEIAQTEEGKATLETVYEIEGLQKVDDTFFDELRVILNRSGLNIEELAAPDN